LAAAEISESAADPSGFLTMSSTATIPDARGLTYSHAGSITGSTSTAILSTDGAGPGTITVICDTSDDRNPPLPLRASYLGS
jgi:hypothetical protein